MVPVVVGAFEVFRKRLDIWIDKLHVRFTIRMGLFPKTALLGKAKILRKVVGKKEKE